MTADELTSKLRSRNYMARARALREASDDPAPALIAVMATALNDEDENVRRSAICALGRMRLPAAKGLLTAALVNDPSALVRSGAAQWLGRTGWDDALLQQRAQTDSDPMVREMARMAHTLRG